MGENIQGIKKAVERQWSKQIDFLGELCWQGVFLEIKRFLAFPEGLRKASQTRFVVMLQGVIFLLITLGGCYEEGKLCKEVEEIPAPGTRLEYPTGVTYVGDLIIVANSNVRSRYCSAFLSVFKESGDWLRNVPAAGERDYSILGELKADKERGFVYVAERKEEAILVFRIEEETLTLYREVLLTGSSADSKGGSDPFGVDVNPMDGTVAVAMVGASEVVLLAPGGVYEKGRIYLRGARPVRVRFDSQGKYLWVLADGTPELYRLSFEGGIKLEGEYKIISSVSYQRPRAFWVGGEEILVGTYYPPAVFELDLGRGIFRGFPLGEEFDPYDVIKHGNDLYVTSIKRDEIWIVDLRRGELRSVIETARVEENLEYGRGPAFIVVEREKSRALVTSYTSGDVIVLNLEEDQVEGYFPHW